MVFIHYSVLQLIAHGDDLFVFNLYGWLESEGRGGDGFRRAGVAAMIGGIGS